MVDKLAGVKGWPAAWGPVHPREDVGEFGGLLREGWVG